MRIVKVQKRPTDILVGVPVEAHHIFQDADYAKCITDEIGVHYIPIKA